MNLLYGLISIQIEIRPTFITYNTEGHYKAVCEAETPCNLNINLKRGYYLLMPDILENINIEKNQKMGDIIQLKLALLF